VTYFVSKRLVGLIYHTMSRVVSAAINNFELVAVNAAAMIKSVSNNVSGPGLTAAGIGIATGLGAAAHVKQGDGVSDNTRKKKDDEFRVIDWNFMLEVDRISYSKN